MYLAGQTYSISLSRILVELSGEPYDEFMDEPRRVDLEYGWLECTPNEKPGLDPYIDLYNYGGLAIMDGEDALVVDADDYTVHLQGLESPGVPFMLSRREFETAVGM